MITHETPDELYTVAEAAAELRVSKPTIWRWIRAGRLPVRRVGQRVVRIRRRDLNRLAAGPDAAPREPHDLAAYILPHPPREISEENLMRELDEINDAIVARNGGKPLSPSLPLIHEQRR